MVWFDGLDLPLMMTLESIFFENHPDLQQPVRGHNLSEQLYAAAGSRRRPRRTAIRSTRRCSATAGPTPSASSRRCTSANGGHQVTVEYLNPATGGPAIRDVRVRDDAALPGRADADAPHDRQLGARRLPGHRPLA